jgi:hypothetical protein
LPFSEANKWYAFALRYQQGNVSLFVDGSLNWSDTAPYPQNIGNKMYIGDADNSHQTPFYGPLDEFIFYNKALSDEEIVNYYEKIK